MINYQNSLTEKETREQILSMVDEAYAIVENIYRQNRSARSEAEIQQIILAALRPIRYARGRGYYFIVRLDGIGMLFADKPEMEGRNLLDIQDPERIKKSRVFLNTFVVFYVNPVDSCRY